MQPRAAPAAPVRSLEQKSSPSDVYACRFTVQDTELQATFAHGTNSSSNETGHQSLFEREPYLMYAMVIIVLSAVTLTVNALVIGMLCRYLGAAQQLELMINVQNLPAEVSGGAGLGVGSNRASANNSITSFGEFQSFGDCDPMEMMAQKSQKLLSKDAESSADFNGVWECTNTWGLEEFLVAMNVSKIKRMAAMRVSWPTWQIAQEGDVFTLMSRSNFGVMTESFKADGSEYQHKDIEGNINTCRAYLKETGFIIERVGKKGRALEHRMFQRDGNVHLTFEMEGCPVKWGRTFRRKP